MTNTIQMTRRTMLTGAAVAGALTPIIVASTAAHADDHAAPAELKGAKKVDLSKLAREKVELVKPPFVHAHDQKAKGGPKIKEFTLTIEEKKMVLDKDGTEVNAMTFNGSVPGPLMVVHQDDYVELTLVNPETNTMQLAEVVPGLQISSNGGNFEPRLRGIGVSPRQP